jgi:hypothetical protein
MKNRLFRTLNRLLISFCIIISTLAVSACGENKYNNCNEVTISGKTLKFGMTEAEITALLGEPNGGREESTEGIKLIYEGLSYLGYEVSDLSLYIQNDKDDHDPKSVKNRGLYYIDIDMPWAVESGLMQRLEKEYGKFVRDDTNLLKGAPYGDHGFFIYTYYFDKSQLSTLKKADADKVKALYESISTDSLTDNSRLADWKVWGNTDNKGITLIIDGNLAAIYNRCIK